MRSQFREIIEFYLKFCEHCELKRAKAKKGIVVQPILSANYLSRAQVDLIDLQARPDGEYKWLMVYQVNILGLI
jgi:hypothetical protein